LEDMKLHLTDRILQAGYIIIKLRAEILVR